MITMKSLLILLGIMIINLITMEFTRDLEERQNAYMPESAKAIVLERGKGIYLYMFLVLGIITCSLIAIQNAYMIIIPLYFITLIVGGYFKKRVILKQSAFNALVICCVMSVVLFAVYLSEGVQERADILVLEYVLFYAVIWKMISKICTYSIKVVPKADWGIVAVSTVIAVINIVFVIRWGMNPAGGNHIPYAKFIVILVIVTDLMILYMVLYYNEKCRRARTYENEAIDYESYKKQLKEVQELDLQLRKTRHDMFNNLNVICMLISGGFYEKAMEFMVKYADQAQSGSLTVRTDNPVINALVNSKISRCKSNNIPIFTTINKDLKSIEDIDITGILGNVLDNAIEASMKLPQIERYIEFKITNEEDNMCIFIRNRINRSVLEENTELNTTKSDKENHGLGTKIVADIVQKYNGYLDYYEDDEFFCCDIRL